MKNSTKGEESNDKRGDRFSIELAQKICSQNDVAVRFSRLVSKIRNRKKSTIFKKWDVARAGGKANLVFEIGEDDSPVVVAVYSVSKANFNHLERKWADKYAIILNWSEEFTELINLFTGGTIATRQHSKYLASRNTSNKERLVWTDFNIRSQKKIINGLSRTRLRMLEGAFCGSGREMISPNGIKYNDKVEIIAFYDCGHSDEKSNWFFCLPSNIIEGVLSEKVECNKKGTVISIGNSVTLQRYGGGAGNGDTSQKAQIQLKVKPRQLFKEALSWKKFDEISEQINFNFAYEESLLQDSIQSKAAKRGLAAERSLIKAINEQNADCSWIVEESCGSNGYGNFEASKPANKEKPDVLIQESTNGGTFRQGISLKTYDPKASFSQANRGDVETYVKDFGIPQNIANTLRQFTIKDVDGNRVMLNKSDNVSQTNLLEFFTTYQRQIISHVLRGKERAELKADWMLFHEAKDDTWINHVGDKSFWRLFPMAEIIDCCCKEKPSITKNGNLIIGVGLTLQRKGGDSGAETANDLQFKINPKLINNTIKSKVS